MHTTDKRVQFDFEIDFSNGGGIQGQGFRLDIDADTIADQALADYIVRDMRLLMVGEVRILNKTIITEAHKRNRPALSVGTRLIDCSHVIEDGMITYKGLPGPIVCDYLSREASRKVYAAGTEFHIGKIEMVANTGTYLDAPSHRFEGAPDLAELRLEQLADLPGVVVDAPAGERSIGAARLPDRALRGCAVLFRTGWSRHFATPRYADGHPFVTAELADALVARGAALVGIDSLNIDDTADGARPVHTALLRAGIPIVEHLTGLAALPAGDFRFFAVPVKVRGMGTFPVRAFAITG